MSLVDVHIPEAYGTLNQSQNYCHNLCGIFFLAYLFGESGIDAPFLWIGEINTVERILMNFLEQRGVRIVQVPAEFTSVRVGYYYTYTIEARRTVNTGIELSSRESPLLKARFREYVAALQEAIPRQDLPRRSLYVTRRGNLFRVPENNLEVEQFFTDRGFEVVDFAEHPFEQQVNLARSADVIVCMHGAGLTNTMFMRPGSRVIELRLGLKTGNNVYKRLSYAMGNRYSTDQLRVAGWDDESGIDRTDWRDGMPALDMGWLDHNLPRLLEECALVEPDAELAAPRTSAVSGEVTQQG